MNTSLCLLAVISMFKQAVDSDLYKQQGRVPGGSTKATVRCCTVMLCPLEMQRSITCYDLRGVSSWKGHVSPSVVRKKQNKTGEHLKIIFKSWSIKGSFNMIYAISCNVCLSLWTADKIQCRRWLFMLHIVSLLESDRDLRAWFETDLHVMFGLSLIMKSFRYACFNIGTMELNYCYILRLW